MKIVYRKMLDIDVLDNIDIQAYIRKCVWSAISSINFSTILDYFMNLWYISIFMLSYPYIFSQFQKLQNNFIWRKLMISEPI